MELQDRHRLYFKWGQLRARVAQGIEPGRPKPCGRGFESLRGRRWLLCCMMLDVIRTDPEDRTGSRVDPTPLLPEEAGPVRSALTSSHRSTPATVVERAWRRRRGSDGAAPSREGSRAQVELQDLE